MKINYIHYYPKFLLKKWHPFVERYDFIKKVFSKTNVSIDSNIGVYKKQSSNQDELWSKTEMQSNAEFIYDGLPIEEYMAVELKEWKPGYIPKKSIKKEAWLVFIKMVLSKAPNTRATKHFFNFLGNDNGHNAWNEKSISDIDSSMIWMEDLGGLRDKSVNEMMKDIEDPNVTIGTLCVSNPLPWINPGHNIWKVGNQIRFALQISPTHILIAMPKDEANLISEKMQDKNLTFNPLLNLAIGLLIKGNQLLSDVVFTNRGDKWFRDILPKLQDEFDEINNKKGFGSISLLESGSSYHVPITINGSNSITLNVKNVNSEISFGQAIIHSTNFKCLFENLEIDPKIKGIPIKNVVGKIVAIIDGKLTLED